LSNLGRHILSLLLLVLLSPGCALQFGGGQQVSWYIASVEGSSVEPGMRTQLRSDFVRAIEYRGIKQGASPLRVEIIGLMHSRAVADPLNGDLGWRSTLTIRAWAPGVDGCDAEVRIRRFWLGEAGSPGLASEARRVAVEKLAELASERALDRLLSMSSCR
jgi:hypothetical protein